MNFYISDSLNTINKNAANAELSDELIDYIYKSKKRISIDVSTLYEIDPYDDVTISSDELTSMAEICIYLLSNGILDDFDDPNEGKQMVESLLRIVNIALSEGKNVISIGD